MIKVLINGTPIYRLEFARRKFKTVGRRKLTPRQVLQAIHKYWNPIDGDLDTGIVSQALDLAAGGKPLYETTALIYIIDAKHGEPPVATAIARQSRLDENSRAVGREVALGRLLYLTRESDDTDVFTPVERAAILAAYKNRHKTPRKPVPPVGSAGSAPIAQVRTPATGKVLSFTQRPSLTLAA